MWEADAQICKEISYGFTRYNVKKIANLEVLHKKNHKAAAEIDVDFAVKATLANLVKIKAASERGILKFRMEYTEFTYHGTCKILEISHVKYKLVRSLFV